MISQELFDIITEKIQVMRNRSMDLMQFCFRENRVYISLEDCYGVASNTRFYVLGDVYFVSVE